MNEDYYVGAYWGPRKETAAACAQRAQLFFHLLARCDPTLTQWYREGRSAPRELPGHPVHPTVSEWEALFLRGRNRTDATREVIERLGFRAIVWNEKKEQTRIELHCGEYSLSGSGNTCLVYPPADGRARERILSASVLTSVATAWDPDFAMATSTEMIRLIQQRKREVRVGWLTYLSRRLGRLPPLPAPVRIEPVGTLGWLLALSSEPMTASNPEHVAFTASVRERLDRAGLIERPPPLPR